MYSVFDIIKRCKRYAIRIFTYIGKKIFHKNIEPKRYIAIKEKDFQLLKKSIDDRLAYILDIWVSNSVKTPEDSRYVWLNIIQPTKELLLLFKKTLDYIDNLDFCNGYYHIPAKDMRIIQNAFNKYSIKYDVKHIPKEYVHIAHNINSLFVIKVNKILNANKQSVFKNNRYVI